MILFFYALIALVVAAGVAVAIQYDSGYLLLAYGQTTVEMTLWVAVAVLAVFCFAVWLLFSFLRRGAKLTDRLGSLRSERRAQRARLQQHRGVVAYVEGNWQKARRLLQDAAHDGEGPLIGYLLAARASQRLGDDKGVVQALSRAEHCGARADVAVALTQAEIQIERGQLEPALATLSRLRSRADRHPAVLGLLARVYRGLNDWTGLRELIPELRKRSLLADNDLASLEELALRGEMRNLQQAGDAAALKQWWRQLSKGDCQAALLRDYIPALLAVAEADEASNLLRQAIKMEWQDDLVLLYASIDDSNPQKQLSTAEGWLKEHSDSTTLLLALGRISLRNELWGKAREYLEQAHRVAPSAAVCFELSRLLGNLGETDAAAAYLSEGMQLQGQQLPSLPQPRG